MAEASAATWQDQVRRGLASDEARERLHTYSTLSTKCSKSKQSQKQVGQLFGSPRNGVVSRFPRSSLLNVLFDDLRSTDRTLRIAAARVVCLMAYENLTNQQLIIRSQVDGDEEQVGVTVGWVHAFSIPQSLRDRYEAHCEERGMFTTPRGLVRFVSALVKDKYASVYSRIGRYYDGGCREFLPLCWFHPLVGDSSESTDLINLPDPSENLVGFFLVPRQMQFPEQDGSFLQEILASIRTEAELSRLQQVHAAFQHVAFRAKDANAAALKTALERIDDGMTESLHEEDALVISQRHNNVLKWLDASPERMITWNELLVWCCTNMNAEEMLKRFGANAYRAIDTAFQSLMLGDDGVQLPEDQSRTHVWEPALVGAVLDHPNLPEAFKTSVRNLSSSYVNRLELSRRKTPHKAPGDADDEALGRPWEYLLPLELTEIHPISWSVFLCKWRQSADAKPDEDDVPSYHQSERRHYSVDEDANPSVLVARKNALAALTQNHRIFHSFRDLNQLRQQLPLITSRPIEAIEEDHEFSSTASRSRSLKGHQLSEAEERELEEKRTLFRRLQQSALSLDEVTKQRLEEKQEARSKAHEKAAENRKKAELLSAQRQQEIERTKRDKQLHVQERLQRKEHRWQMLVEARRERHQRAQWWKQIQLEAEVARQEEFYLRQKGELEAARRTEQNQQSEPAAARFSTVSLPEPLLTPPASERRPSCPRRPSSARRETDPRIVRERGHVYGNAATEAFAARRPQTARPDFCSGARSPRTRPQPGFRRRVRPGGSRNDSFSASFRTDSNREDPQPAGVANACATLVMTNAAHAVAEHIAIPPVATPVPEEEPVPPAVIMAQYWALEKEQRVKLHERYCVNRVSHRLTFAVLQQLTHEMRQDAAWREFLKAAGGPPGTHSKQNKSKREAKVTHAAFATVASQLGVSMPHKKLQAVARSLDPWKTGSVSWESFYIWWSAQ